MIDCAGFDIRVEFGGHGLKIALTGFSDSFFRLFESLIDVLLFKFKINENRFEMFKNKLIRHHKNRFVMCEDQIGYVRRLLLNYRDFTVM